MDVRKMASMGQKAMRQKQSKAEKIFWALLAGRSRQSTPSLMEAIHLGRSTATRIHEAMTEAGLHPLRDSRCALACATENEKVKIFVYAQEGSTDVADLEMARAIVNHKPRLEPIGLGFFILDRENGSALMKVRPFVGDNKGGRLMEAVLLEWERIVGELNKKGLGALKGN